MRTNRPERPEARALGRVGAVALVIAVLLVLANGPAAIARTDGTPGPGPCDEVHWVGAWAAPASDAAEGANLLAQVDPSVNRRVQVANSTVRAVATPTIDGGVVRVRLSNRFGRSPVTFDRATVAWQEDGPSLVAGTVTELRFDGGESATVPPGEEVVSDPAVLEVQAGRPLAISVHVAGDVGSPTTHYTARQTSFATPPGAGDHTGDLDGRAFTQRTTSRPFLVGMDVETPRSVGAVVAFGDSITDGYEGRGPRGIPEAAEGLDEDVRYPDLLAARIREAGVPLAVLNAGISSNRLLESGQPGTTNEIGGIAGLERLDADVIDQAGATTAILFIGINDLGSGGGPTPEEIIDGYRDAIARLQAAGLTVVHATLTPAGRSGAGEEGRQRINEWIRTESPADAVVDFDAALRDAGDPARLDPAFDPGDGLHLNRAGNQALADAIDLDDLRRPSCEGPGGGDSTADAEEPSDEDAGARRWVPIGIVAAAAALGGAWAVRIKARRG